MNRSIFKNVYQLSFVGGEIKSNDAYRLMCDRLTKDRYNTAEEKELLTQYLNDKYHSNEEMIENSVGFKSSYTGYLLQAFGVWLGRLMNLSFNRIYMLGKFMNLLLYAIGMFFCNPIDAEEKGNNRSIGHGADTGLYCYNLHL